MVLGVSEELAEAEKAGDWKTAMQIKGNRVAAMFRS
jgi:hypothetical protein